jgi:DNA-binding NtrC family response regulator
VRRVVAVVRDLFFVARIRETAKLVDTPLGFARGLEELGAALEGEPPGLVIIDLTTPGWDHAALLEMVAERAPGVPVLGYTTHVLARQTQPLHGRCDRVVTKEALSQELPDILRGAAVA